MVLDNVSQRGTCIPVAQGGFKAYVEFASVDEALNFPLELEVDGETARLWHRGKFECETCKEKGHTADHHEKHMSGKERAGRDTRKRNGKGREKKGRQVGTKSNNFSSITFSLKLWNLNMYRDAV